MSGQAIAPGKLLDCTSFSSTFPPSVIAEIPRDAVLNLIDDFLAKEFQLVTIDGRPDIGKTRIMAQFARLHCHNAFSIFVRPNSYLLGDSRLLLADLASQMYWALKRQEMTDPHTAMESDIRRLSFDLQRQFKKDGRPFYFIIDGLDDVTDNVGQFTSTLLSILPFEYSGFRFLVAGDGNWIPNGTLTKLNTKQHTVAGFTFGEASSYFAGCGLDADSLEEIYRSCARGTPGYLASVHRCLDSGASAEKLIEELPKAVPTPFELEWQIVDQKDECLLNVLAILAHDSQPHSLTELAVLTDTSPHEVRIRLSSCRFIELPNRDTDGISYISNSFKSYAAEQLMPRRAAVWERLAEYLLTRGDDPESVQLLPTYLERAGRQDDLLSVLQPDKFIQLAETADSLMPLRERSELGLDTAISLNKTGEALRFGVQASVIADVSVLRVAKSEIMARLAVEDYSAAIGLAQSAVLKRQRFQLLVAIARNQREKGLTPEPALIDQLTNLSEQVDVREFGDELVNVAADLMYAIPQLALSLMSKVSSTATDDRAVDWALAKLSITAAGVMCPPILIQS